LLKLDQTGNSAVCLFCVIENTITKVRLNDKSSMFWSKNHFCLQIWLVLTAVWRSLVELTKIRKTWHCQIIDVPYLSNCWSHGRFFTHKLYVLYSSSSFINITTPFHFHRFHCLQWSFLQRWRICTKIKLIQTVPNRHYLILSVAFQIKTIPILYVWS
jgi:hypothetical protein